MNCSQCMHYLVCKHTEEAEKLKQAYDKMDLKPTAGPLSIKVVCEHEKHSNDIIAAR